MFGNIQNGKNFLLAAIIIIAGSCNKWKEYTQKPELESLQQGLKTSIVIGYCVSVATSAYKGNPLPANISFDKGKGLIHIHVSRDYPLPLNNSYGDILIACHWENNSGIMSVIFGNLDILGGSVKLYGFYLVPFMENSNGDGIQAVFAKQDIIMGVGSDTILNLGNLSVPVFNSELERLNSPRPLDPFVAVKQNVWFVNVNQNNTGSEFYDDSYTISGGGQIAEVKGESGGVVYHAIIDAQYNYAICSKNPTSGYALSQNFKAGGEPFIDLGNSLLHFHDICDGKAHVDISTGKYISYLNKDISLGLPY